MHKIILWIKHSKFEFSIILLILSVAAILRFYQLPEYMTFLGDEGRDALIVRKLLEEGDIPFIGPPTSVGNIYLGPLYYYMMAIPMAIFKLNPVAPAAMVALIGVLVVLLIYYLTREWFGKFPATLASVLYAVSPIAIIYSRSSWNPNPAPFFSLLTIGGLYLSRKNGNFLWFILTGGALAAAIQMHYLALILIPTVGILWLWEFYSNLKNELPRKNFLLGTIGAFVVFCFLMSPLVIFDFEHNFLNYRAIRELFASSGTVGLQPIDLPSRALTIYKDDLIGRYMAGGQSLLVIVLSLLVILPIILAFYQKIRRQIIKWSYLALGIYLILGILGLSFYKHEIYDHYLGFLNPIPYVLFGGAIASILLYTPKKLRLVIRAIFLAFVVILVMVNLQKNPLKYPPNMQLQRTQEIAKFIINEAEGKPFNFALIAQNNYDAAYQFYLGYLGHKPKHVQFDLSEQLFVVCEDPICQPINNSKIEIAAFGWAKIEKESQILGVRVFKLVHNPTGSPF